MTNEEIIQRLEEIDDWVCDIHEIDGRVHIKSITKIRDLIEELKSERSE